MARKNTSVAAHTRVRIDVKILLGILLGPVLVAGVWLFFTTPATTASQTASQQAAAAAAADSAAVARLAKLQSGAGSLAQQYLAQAYKLDQLLPPDTDQVAAGQEILTAASKAGVTVTQMNPSSAPATTTPTTAAVSGLTPTTFQAQVSGTPTQITVFFTNLTHLPRLVTITQAQVATSSPTATTAATTTAAATLQVWTFAAPTLPDSGD